MGKLHRLIFWVLTATLSIYVILRALVLSFTIDEAMTYNYVIDIWPDVVRANDHFLNTQAMKLTRWLFGDSEFALRLPNLLSFGLYAWGVYRITKHINGIWIYSMAVVLLYAQPTLIEFFGLARGYGMGMGLWMLSMSFFLKAVQSKESDLRNAHFSLVLGGLAISAYAALLNVYIAVIALLALNHILRNRRERSNVFRNGLWALIVLPIPFLARTILELLSLRKAEELYYGTESFSAWMDNTYGYFFAAGREWTFLHIIVTVIVSLLVLWGAYQVLQRKDISRMYAWVFFIFVISNLGWVLEHLLFDSRLPQGRTNLVNYTLLLLLVTGSLENLDEYKNRWRRGWLTIGAVGTLGLAVLFIVQMNLTYVIAWKFSAKMKEVSQHADDLTRYWHGLARMEKHASFRSNINYYIRSRNMNIATDMTPGIRLEDELLLIRTTDFKHKFTYPALVQNYVQVYISADFEVALYARKDVYAKAQEHGYPYKTLL